MCPAPFKATRRLPQARAKASARAGVTYGSSVLATTTLGNGSRTSGTGVKLWTASSTLAIISTSAGATSSAALIPPPPAAAPRCATSAQPRLWATSTGGAAHPAVLRPPQALPVPGTGAPVAGQQEHGGPRGAHAADVDAARRRAQRTTTGPQIGRRMKNCAIRPPLATPVAPATLALMAVTRQSAPTTKK